MQNDVWTMVVVTPDGSFGPIVSAHENERECLLALKDREDSEGEFRPVPDEPDDYDAWVSEFQAFFNFQHLAIERHDVELAPNSYVVARFETRNFEFEGVGSDEFTADLALKVAWKRHCLGSARVEGAGGPGLRPGTARLDYLEENWDDVQHLTYTIGKSYRDGSEI